MELKLKPLGALVTVDDLVYPFSLQAVGDVYLHRLKFSNKIVRLKKDYINRESRIQLASIKTDKPTQFIRLPIDQKTVFDSADWNQKNLLMSDAYLLPDCTVKSNTHYLKSRLTEEPSFDNNMMASLTSAGIIELYKYYFGNHQLFKLPVDLVELRKEELSKKVITSYDLLIETYNRVAFANFEWCPVDFGDFKLLLTVSKSDEILIFNIQEESAKIHYRSSIEGASKSEIKWTFNEKDGHSLYVGVKNGNLKRFSLNILKNGNVKSLKEVEEFEGKIEIPPSYIYVDQFEEDTIIICCKNHSLEIVHKGTRNTSVISRYIGVSITGFDKIGSLEYVVSTLNSTVYFVKLALNVNGELEIEQHQKIEILLSSDDEEVQLNSSRMSYYGITTSKNKIFVYISSSPHHATDHLVVKQPAHLTANLWLAKNPHEILTSNTSLSLTNYADCIEAVRMLGLTSVKSLNVLEEMNYDIKINDEFIYYLKLQLIVIKTKILYYFTRSQNILDIFKTSKDLIIELIKVIKTCILLEERLVSASVHNLVTIRAMKKFLIGYTRKPIENMPFKDAKENLEPKIMELIERCASLKVKQSPELCQFCEELIPDDEEFCTQNHLMKRCAITNLQIPLDCKNFCTQCLVSVTTLDNLTALFGNSVNYLCPFCDNFLTFYE